MPVARLHPAPWNPRSIKDDRFENLKRSLEADPRLLELRPILATADGEVYAGNMRLRAAIALGWPEVPAVIEDVDERTKRERMIRDNAQWGEWEDAYLARILAEIAAEGSDTAVLGLEARELDRILATIRAETEDPDAVPAVNETPTRVRAGEIWQMGQHRLICGDSTSREAVGRLAGSVTFHAIVTDPPYGISKAGVTNDDEEGLTGLFDGMLAAAPLADAVVAAFQSPRLVPVWIDAIRKAGHDFERLLWLYRKAAKTYPWRGWVLASDPIVLSSVGRPHWPTIEDGFCHDTYVKTELEEAELTGLHPTIKPSWVVEDLIRKLPQGGPIYEPFAGSGTTLIAAERTKRACYAVEIDPRYCDVIIARWEQFSGGTAVRS